MVPTLRIGLGLLLVGLLPRAALAKETEHKLEVYDLFKLHECHGDSTPVFNGDHNETAFSDAFFTEHEVEEIEAVRRMVSHFPHATTRSHAAALVYLFPVF